MRNMNSIISADNRSILTPSTTNYDFIFRDNTNCSLQISDLHQTLFTMQMSPSMCIMKREFT